MPFYITAIRSFCFVIVYNLKGVYLGVCINFLFFLNYCFALNSQNLKYSNKSLAYYTHMYNPQNIY